MDDYQMLNVAYLAVFPAFCKNTGPLPWLDPRGFLSDRPFCWTVILQLGAKDALPVSKQQNTWGSFMPNALMRMAEGAFAQSHLDIEGMAKKMLAGTYPRYSASGVEEGAPPQ